MPKKQLIIPHYCRQCRHLIFLVREGEPFQFQLMDFLKGAWKIHSCAQIQPALTEEVASQPAFNDIGWAPDTIPFDHQPAGQPKKRQSLSIGIILSVDQNRDSTAARVITPENQLLNLRILDTHRTITVGKAINLKKAVRVGKEKYRLEKLDFINPGTKAKTYKSKADPFYQLILTAQDQEKLETFINRIVTICNKERILPINIIPQPIESENSEQLFRRDIHLPLQADLLLKIEKITVPESVQVSVRHE